MLKLIESDQATKNKKNNLKERVCHPMIPSYDRGSKVFRFLAEGSKV